MARRDGREDAGDGHGIDAATQRYQETANGLSVEGHDLATVEFDAAGHDGLAGGNRPSQVLRPGQQGPDRQGCRCADAQHRNTVESTTLQDRVGGVGRAQHGVTDARPVDMPRGQHRVDGSLDARGDVGTRGHLGLGQQLIFAVEHHRVRISATDVDTQPQVQATTRRNSTGSGSGSRHAGAPPGQLPVPGLSSSTGR